MKNINGFIELLESVTVDCKDDGNHFVVPDRVSVIERLLGNTEYRLVAREPLALVYAKRELCAGDDVVLVSSHVDSLHASCFCNDEGDFLRGTFDNSFGNAAILWHMLAGKLPDNVVVAFTGDEEHNSQGAVQVVLSLGRMQCNIKFVLVLDVTNTGCGSGASFALENDLGIDMVTAYKIIEAVNSLGLEYAFEHNAEPDESWDYNDYGIPSLSLCVPVQGCLHGDSGVMLNKMSVAGYCKALLSIVVSVGN